MTAIAAAPTAMAAFLSSGALAAVRTAQMTSANTPNGVVSASTFATDYAPWRAFDRSPSNGWLTAIGSVANQWLQYTFPTPVFIHSVDISGYVGSAARSIKDFSIQRSVDGVEWSNVLIASAPANAVADLRRFSFGAAGKSRYWRILIASNHGDPNFIGISEADFVGFVV